MDNKIKTFLLLGGLTIFLIFMGKLIGGRSGMYIAFLLALAMNFFSFGSPTRSSSRCTAPRK